MIELRKLLPKLDFTDAARRNAGILLIPDDASAPSKTKLRGNERARIFHMSKFLKHHRIDLDLAQVGTCD